MIKILIVEDSRVVSEYLYYILSRDPQIQVIGNVSNGKLAVEFIKEHKTDVITMDIDMPVMDGLEATRIIMSTTPVPILIVTASRNAREVSTSIEALAAGALAIIEKPVGPGHPREQELSGKLVSMVKLMAEVTVVKHSVKQVVKTPGIPVSSLTKTPASALIFPEIIVIGVSSGGPQTLPVVFSKITAQFPAPIVVVQHIARGFLNGLVSWMGNMVKMPIQIAQDAGQLLPGHIYFAPDGFQASVTRTSRINLVKGDGKNGFCPSVADLFSSVAHEFGNRALGIILTGMGSDGAKELKLLRDTGATTIAQSKESSLIHGMPGVAIQLGAARYIFSAEEISVYLADIETSYRKGKTDGTKEN